MSDIYVMAISVGSPAVDHVYLKTDDDLIVWPCFGRSAGGVQVAVLRDADLEAAVRECPPNGSSILYGIEGIAHQQANRILAAALREGQRPVMVPGNLRGLRASYFVWGKYGRRGGKLLKPPGTVPIPASTVDPSTADAKLDIPIDLSSPDGVRGAELLFVSKDHWQRLITYLSANPEFLRTMEPRKFEELVAELLAREGLEVELTPAQKDGGRDILAYLNTDLGRHLYLVECKRYKAERPVGVEFVRSLYGVVEYERATAGLLVTTSTFTAPAMEFQRTVQHRMTLREYTHLCEWLRRYATPS